MFLCIYRGLHTIVKKKDLIGFTKDHDILARRHGQVVLLLALLSWLPVSAECSQIVDFFSFLFFFSFCRVLVFCSLLALGWFRYSVALRPQKPPAPRTVYVHRNRRLIRGREPRTATSTFTQLPGRFTSTETVGLLGAGSPGLPPRLSHSS